jgi:hypothetical protein
MGLWVRGFGVWGSDPGGWDLGFGKIPGRADVCHFRLTALSMVDIMLIMSKHQLIGMMSDQV